MPCESQGSLVWLMEHALFPALYEHCALLMLILLGSSFLSLILSSFEDQADVHAHISTQHVLISTQLNTQE